MYYSKIHRTSLDLMLKMMSLPTTRIARKPVMVMWSRAATPSLIRTVSFVPLPTPQIPRKVSRPKSCVSPPTLWSRFRHKLLRQPSNHHRRAIINSSHKQPLNHSTISISSHNQLSTDLHQSIISNNLSSRNINTNSALLCSWLYCR